MEHVDVVLTGAAGGIGRSTVEHLRSLGMRVFALDIDQERLNQLGYSADLVPIRVDVTSVASLRTAFDVVRQRTEGLHAIVSNAGWFDQFPLSEGEIEAFEHIVSVNVLAAHRVFRTFFPLLLPQEGRVIHVSSESALSLMPFQAYGMTKRMLDTYSAVLRQELRLLDMPVVTIRPGAHCTPFIQRSKDVLSSIDENSIYRSPLENVRAQGMRILNKVERDPKHVAEAIGKALTVSRPKKVYSVNVSMAFRILHWLPAGLQEKLFRMIITR